MTQISKDIHENSNRKALLNATHAYKKDSGLPDYVFSARWEHFLFCQSDWMFCEEFVDAIKTFINIEQANVACLLHITTQSSSIVLDDDAAIYLNKESTGKEYMSLLRGDGPETGWLYHMDNFICTSDVGNWSMYCERSNEVAVIALSNTGLEQFRPALELMRAFPLGEACLPGSEGVFPFNSLSPEWHDGLFKNYA